MPELAMIDAGDVAEVVSLGRALAEAYTRRVEWYQEAYSDKWPEALAEHTAAVRGEFGRRAETEPADQVTFSSLADLAQHDPDAAHVAWLRVKQEAQADLMSGHCASVALKLTASAWERAQFLAIRDAFQEQWQPANGGEVLLVDMLAQTYALWQEWLAVLTISTQAQQARRLPKEHPDFRFEPPRVTAYEATEQAVAMVDRFNRMYLRTLRQLRDLRRYASPVTINNPAQVNIGQQQVNVADVSPEIP